MEEVKEKESKEVVATNITEESQDSALKEILEKIYEKIGNEAKNDIEKEKEQKTDVYLFINDDENLFFFKALKAREYKTIKKESENEEELEVNIIKASVIYPKLTNEIIDNMYAGLYEALSKFTLAASAFNESAPVIKV